MRITYDPAKRERTLRERGRDFEDAATVFDDRHTREVDDRRDYGEERIKSVGRLRGRVVVLIWTTRDEARRIISMRHAHASEGELYREALG